MAYWRSWPWKKRPSNSNSNSKSLASSASFRASLACLGDQPRASFQDLKYVQISMESYERLSGMEDQVGRLKEQVKALDGQVNDLREKLSAALSELTAKDNLAKQHAKVAEDAVSGWEKANAQALTAMAQLDSLSLSKLAAEDRVSHLDAALKECMREMTSFKEQNKALLHKINNELKAKIIQLDQQLLHTTAENTVLSHVIMKNNEEISEARSEIELLKHGIKSSKNNIYSPRYELHAEDKERGIQNEEKTVCVNLAQVANNQYLESMKTISKLKAECRRIHELVNLGHDVCEPQSWRTSVEHTNPYFFMCPDISTDNLHAHEEKEFLSTCLLAMGDELYADK